MAFPFLILADHNPLNINSAGKKRNISIQVGPKHPIIFFRQHLVKLYALLSQLSLRATAEKKSHAFYFFFF